MCNIILSLMPGKLATFVELFGYHGDRKAGLELLVRAGGWDVNEEEPSISTGKLLLYFSLFCEDGFLT
jgi:hypothetical protein